MAHLFDFDNSTDTPLAVTDVLILTGINVANALMDHIGNVNQLIHLATNLAIGAFMVGRAVVFYRKNFGKRKNGKN